uniref:Uncharacterized protein n=1 Tax=Medicago truncatula TaxID=3880 RepID=I3S4J8_MEDTR|nr:unknown [Medicago truncatula]
MARFAVWILALIRIWMNLLSILEAS